MKVENYSLKLDAISIYRNLLEDVVIKKMKALINYIGKEDKKLNEGINLYNDFFLELMKLQEESLEEYIINKILFDENPFSSIKSMEDKRAKLIKKCAASDIEKLQKICKLDAKDIKLHFLECFGDENAKIVKELPEWKVKSEKDSIFSNYDNWGQAIDDLESFHIKNGCGIFAEYKAFVWEKDLCGKTYFNGVKTPDPVSLEELIGYEQQREVIIENTLQFLKGYAANNVLLHGDRGTGKSSTVKAILNEYYNEGLRMIEVPKACLKDFPIIIRNLKGRNQKFIIFVDDLVFGDDEESYTALKAVLDGGIENKSSNILIYATSNRRHLVKEYFNERPGVGEEVHGGDSVQEKLSLADRFGINVVFSAPDQNKYLQIVEGLAKRRNLNIDIETLHREAKKWELWYNGKSARTARQFVDWIEGHINM